MTERCQHCGREGVLKYVEDVVFSTRPTKVSYDNGYVEEVEDQQVLQIHRCEGCGAPTVLSYRYIDGWSDPSDYMELRQVFPVPRSFGDLPDRVAERYRRMLELQYEPDAFAVRAGRVLEAVCSHEGVTEGDLGPRLDQLAGKKRETIPRALAAQAHLVREFRNVGGHDDDVELRPPMCRLSGSSSSRCLSSCTGARRNLSGGDRSCNNVSTTLLVPTCRRRRRLRPHQRETKAIHEACHV